MSFVKMSGNHTISRKEMLHIFESQILISLFEKKKNSLSAALKDDIDGTTLFYESNNNDKAKLQSNDKWWVPIFQSNLNYHSQLQLIVSLKLKKEYIQILVFPFIYLQRS